MKIAVLFGGYSFEHEISIVSAISMKKVLKSELVYIFLDKNREFYEIPADIIKSKLFSTGDYKKFNKLDLGKNGFEKKGFFGAKKVEFDTLLNLIHGGDGEDGVIASMLDFYGIPFIGPRFEACSVSFNKYLTKGYSSLCGVKSVDFEYFHKDEKVELENFPVIIKPVRLGSSIGVSIVKSKDELQYALDVAFEFDDAVIIEPFIEGVKEYNLAGAKINGEFNFSVVEEPVKEQFLDFDKKYLDFNRTSQVNEANISEELVEKLKDAFKKIYNHKFEGSLIRCDFFVIDNEVYLNEINPIPGSMGNYLFDDFNAIINGLSKSLPSKTAIDINYEYVNKIQSAKGKA
jgi:D-alanine-D-alanine ligase